MDIKAEDEAGVKFNSRRRVRTTAHKKTMTPRNTIVDENFRLTISQKKDLFRYRTYFLILIFLMHTAGGSAGFYLYEHNNVCRETMISLVVYGLFMSLIFELLINVYQVMITEIKGRVLLIMKDYLGLLKLLKGFSILSYVPISATFVITRLEASNTEKEIDTFRLIYFTLGLTYTSMSVVLALMYLYHIDLIRFCCSPLWLCCVCPCRVISGESLKEHGFCKCFGYCVNRMFCRMKCCQFGGALYCISSRLRIYNGVRDFKKEEFRTGKETPITEIRVVNLDEIDWREESESANLNIEQKSSRRGDLHSYENSVAMVDGTYRDDLIMLYLTVYMKIGPEGLMIILEYLS